MTLAKSCREEEGTYGVASPHTVALQPSSVSLSSCISKLINTEEKGDRRQKLPNLFQITVANLDFYDIIVILIDSI